MDPNFNHICKVPCNGLNCVPSAPNSCQVLNIGIFGRAIILLTAGLTGNPSQLWFAWLCLGTVPHGSYTISETMDWTTGLLLTNTPKAREQTPNNWSLHGKHDPAFSAPHIQESIPVSLEVRSLSTRVSILGCLWKLPVLLSQQGPLIPSMHAWLGAADLGSLDSSHLPFSSSTSLEALFIQHLLLRSQINCSSISIPLALYTDPQNTALFYRCLLWICWIMFYSSFPLSDYTISPFLHWEMCNRPCFPFPNALESNSQSQVSQL